MIIWDRIYNWFSDIKERNGFLREWNKRAKEAFIDGDIPTLLEARTTIGSFEFKHDFSKFMAGGFRVKALSGKSMTKAELLRIGNMILSDEKRVKQLVAHGYDTLEVHDSHGVIGLKWQIVKHIISLPSKENDN